MFDMAAAVFTGVIGVVTQMLGFFVMLGAMLTGFLLELAVKNLNYVLSPNFISLCYTCTNTDPALGPTNPFIAMGWDLTRGLANIIFVLALIAIAIGTILGKASYHAKQTLPLLIAIALLINFTPLILGFMVDASNIVMNYFLGAGFVGGEIWRNNMESAKSIWTSGFQSMYWNPTSGIGTFVGLSTIVFFNILSSFILFIFASVFTIRYVAIWLLVILSPLAFACRILPATKKYWDEWWKQFVQWTIIGIIGSFFLYLGGQLINMISNKEVVLGVSKSSGPDADGIFNTVLPWGIGIGVLLYGLIMSFQTSAMGASQIMNFTGAKLKTVPGFAGGLAKRRIYDRIVAGQAAKGEKGLFGRLSRVGGDLTGWKRVVAEGGSLGVLAGVRKLARTGLKQGAEVQANAVDGAKKKYDNFVKTKNWSGLAAQSTFFSSDSEKIAIASILGEKGQANKLEAGGSRLAADLARKYSPQHLNNVISAADPYNLSEDKEIQAAIIKDKDYTDLPLERKRGLAKDAISMSPDFLKLSESEQGRALKIVDSFTKEQLDAQITTDRGLRTYLVKKSIIEKSPKEAFDDDFFKNPQSMKIFINTKNPSTIGDVLKNLSSSTTEELHGAIQKQVETVEGLLRLTENNGGLLRYLAAQGGISGVKPINIDIKGTRFENLGEKLGDIDGREKIKELNRLLKEELEQRHSQSSSSSSSSAPPPSSSSSPPPPPRGRGGVGGRPSPGGNPPNPPRGRPGPGI